VQKAATLQGSFSHTYRTWESVLALLENGAMNLDAIVGAVEPLENWQRAFDAMYQRKVIKAVLTP
jgi:L-iditol 2-dehydrogenase